MNHTLKTYPDGSQITTKHAAAFAGFCVAVVAVSTVGAVKVEEWKQRRHINKEIKKLKK